MAPHKGLTGGNEANTEAIINAQVEQANKAIEALKKKQPKKTTPKLTGSPMAMIKAQQEADASYNAAMEQYNAQLEAAEGKAKAWTDILSAQANRKQAALAQQAAERKRNAEGGRGEAVEQGKDAAGRNGEERSDRQEGSTGDGGSRERAETGGRSAEVGGRVEGDPSTVGTTKPEGKPIGTTTDAATVEAERQNPKTTPEQEALLGGTNPHQYPTERELSGSKGKQKTETKQGKDEKSSENNGGLSEEAGQDGDVAEAWVKFKEKYPDRVALVRIGDNYHIYGEDAKKAAEILGIKKTKHENPKLGCEVTFPIGALDTYLPKLIRSGNRIAMVDIERQEQKIKRPSAKASEPRPIGKGAFGDIYDAFRGKAKEAVDFLRKKKSGEALGALHHKDIGDIDLVWGEEGSGKSDGFGLAKLVKYHPEVLDNLQEIIDDMEVTSRSENRVQLESKTHQAAVRLTWNKEKKNWLLTAFEKKNSVSDNTTDTGETLSGKGNDTATPQNTVSPVDKGTKKNGAKQEKTEKNAAVEISMPHPELGRSDKRYLLEDGEHAYKLAVSEVSALHALTHSYKDELFERFKERYHSAVGDFIFKQHEPYLKDFFDYFEQKADMRAAAEPVREHKADGVAPLTKEERVLRDALGEVMQKNGLDVIGSEAGQRVLDEANKDVKLHTRDIGGKYDYPAVEEDTTMLKPTIREHRVNYYNPRSSISPVRGGWTKEKIKRRLKDLRGSHKGYSFAAKLISEFDSPEELAEHMFYHGTYYGGGALKPSVLMSDREIERYGGGGYGEKYWGISVSRSKKIASRFSSHEGVRIYPIILAKNAKVTEMPDATDAADLEDHITELWEQGVDAVWIGDKNKGEQELCVLNPQAIVNIDSSDYYKYFKLGSEENPLHIIDKAGIEKLYDDAVRFQEQKENAPHKPKKPSRFAGDNFDELKDEAEYQRELEEYNERLREFESSQEYKDWEKAKSEAYRNIRFFRTKDGEAYGFTVGGKIYYDPRIATSETLVHEYAHLWATALKAGNPKEWKNVVSLMKGTSVWNEVKKLYPELKTDDAIADEVIAQYSGRRGAERLREEARKIAEGEGSVFEKAEAISALERVKQALQKFWKGVCDFLHIHYTSAEEVADRVMKDLLDGVDPRKFGKTDGKVRMQFVGENGAKAADHAEEVTTRLDNLAVAREMEEAKKDAKAIKMATGWERGADGKWRYEIGDAKIVDEKDFGRGYKEKRDESDMLWTEGKLGDVVDAPDLLKAYPKLKDVRIVCDELTDDQPSNGSYNPKTKTITIHATEVKYLNSLLNHEIQHAIQEIEGFAQGGSTKLPSLKETPEYKAWEEQVARLREESSEEKELNETIAEYSKEYNELFDRIESFENSSAATGEGSADLLNRQKKVLNELEGEINELVDKLEEVGHKRGEKVQAALDSVEGVLWNLYDRLAGEVESRNVEKRMGMTPEERRASLASETEDVAREDQIFLMGEGGESTADESAEARDNDVLFRDTEKSRAAYAARQWRRAHDVAKDWLEKLHTGDITTVYDSIDDVPGSAGFSARRRQSKGWYDPKTGKIVIVMGNHRSPEDVLRTILHESVAHYGLRKLFGVHFDDFLDNVYDAAERGIRETIDAKMQALKDKGTGSKRTDEEWRRAATEEYLADLSEDIDFEHDSNRPIKNHWFNQIKSFFLQMLNRIGLKGFGKTLKGMLSDNELRYILWRSYQNMANPGRYRSILGEAEDVAKQAELKVGNYAEVEAQKVQPKEDKETKDMIKRLVYLAKTVKDKVHRLVLGNVSERQIRDFHNEGLDVDGTWRHSIENSRIIHAQKEHGVKDTDFEMIPDILRSYDDVSLSDNVNGEGNKVIIYTKSYPDGTTYYLEEVRNGRKSLAFQTMYKKEGSNSSDGLLTKSTPKRPTTTSDNLTSSSAKLGNISATAKSSGENVDDDTLLFRDGDDREYEKAMARDTYERRVARGMYQTQEALQDSMLGLKEAMEAVMKAEGNYSGRIEDVAGYENAYLGENRLSSVNQAEMGKFARTLWKPLLAEVSKLAKTADQRAELTDYMMAKHGLERNDVMARRDAAKKANALFGADIRKAEYAVNKDPLDQDAADALDDLRQRRDDKEEELYLSNRGRDYAGLTALTKTDNVVDAEAEAQKMVDSYELSHITSELWAKTTAVTDATLTKSYASGMIDRDTYNDIKGMYQHYIPLRGFDETTSDEVYAYLNDRKSAFSAVR